MSKFETFSHRRSVFNDFSFTFRTRVRLRKGVRTVDEVVARARVGLARQLDRAGVNAPGPDSDDLRHGESIVFGRFTATVDIRGDLLAEEVK